MKDRGRPPPSRDLDGSPREPGSLVGRESGRIPPIWSDPAGLSRFLPPGNRVRQRPGKPFGGGTIPRIPWVAFSISVCLERREVESSAHARLLVTPLAPRAWRMRLAGLDYGRAGPACLARLKVEETAPPVVPVRVRGPDGFSRGSPGPGWGGRLAGALLASPATGSCRRQGPCPWPHRLSTFWPPARARKGEEPGRPSV